MSNITSNSTENTSPLATNTPATAEMQQTIQPGTTITAPLSQHPVSQTSPTFISSRPASPSSPHGSFSRPSHPQIHRPSSSLSSSSRRASLLSPPDPALPQRLPRSPPADAAAFAELHQELEAEQEAQVNRLLNMIRLQNLQATSNDGDANSNAATVDSASTRAGRPRSPMSASAMSRRGSNRLSRDGSYYRPRSVSRASSPGLTAGGDSASESSLWVGSGPTDEAGFYAAESQMLKRENEMLKRRIRELERMVSELNAKATGGGGGSTTDAATSVPVSMEFEVSGPAVATA